MNMDIDEGLIADCKFSLGMNEFMPFTPLPVVYAMTRVVNRDNVSQADLDLIEAYFDTL